MSVPPLSAGSFAASEELEQLAENSDSSISSASLSRPQKTAEKTVENGKRQNLTFMDWTQHRNVKDTTTQQPRAEVSSSKIISKDRANKDRANKDRANKDRANEAHEPLSREEFAALIETHRQQIVLYLVSMVQNIADAEDLCQKCCVIMWQKRAEYDRSKSFLPWACGIARLESYNHRRSRSTERLLFSSDVLNLLATSLEEMGNSSQDQRLSALKKCVKALPELEQSFLRRIYWEGNSFESIASDLGCSPRTFYNRMYLLRRRLWRCVSRKLVERD